MTTLQLLEAFAGFVEEETKELRLKSRVERNSTDRAYIPPHVYKGKLPTPEGAQKLAPYILLKVLNSKDDETPKEGEESTCYIRLIVVTYEEDGQENYLQCLNVIEKIRQKLLEQRVIDNRYTLQLPLETLMYEDNTDPYQMGEMMSKWELPTIQRVVDLSD